MIDAIAINKSNNAGNVSIELVLLIEEFLKSLIKTRALWDRLREMAESEGLTGPILKMLLQHHAKRLRVDAKSIYNWTKQLEDSTSQNREFPENDYNNVLGLHDIKLLQGDFMEQANKHISNDSVELIFTDPPYSRDKLRYYSDLSQLAQRVLKPGGSLITFVGQYALPEILNRLSEKLTFWWTICLKHSGQHAPMYYKRVFVEWKPLVWFVKGETLLKENEGQINERETEFLADFIQSTIPDKQHHEWAQSVTEAEYIIPKLTLSSSSIVYDPFLGSGTTALAALKFGRKFIGSEINAERFANAKHRIYCNTIGRGP